MSITEQDELEHPASDDWLWRESLYFNFHDASGKVGGTTTIGVRPNQNRFEGFAIIFLDAQVLFYRTEGLLEGGKAGLFSVPGITYKVLTPLQNWRFEVVADLSHVDPQHIVRDVRLPETTVPAGFDLTFDALSPAYEFSTHAMELLSVAARHYEQNGRIKGRGTVGGQTFAVDGFGFRDHSWGVRDLSRMGDVVALFAQFGPSFTVNTAKTVREGQEIAMGYISHNGVNIPVSDIQIALETDPLSKLPKATQAQIDTVDGRHLVLEAEIAAVMPIFFKQGEAQFHWYECSARFRCGQQTGYGITEVTEVRVNSD
jgi:hypothetical protein